VDALPKLGEMEHEPPHGPLARVMSRRVRKKGLTPRVAASVIAGLWAIGVIVFGVLERLVDPDSFDNVWLGMWWALQTVTTVGYGDVVPAGTAGKLIAAFLMLGGLSLFAVVTGAVTSIFVAQAQAERQKSAADPMMRRFDEMSADLRAIKAELARRDRHGES
jgi:voltage-gated potassium channel